MANWPEYDAALRQRGSLTFWVEAEVLEHWQNTGKAGQARYTDMAIQASLMLRTVFKLAFRQTEGLMTSLIEFMALALKGPDHTTVSRRSATLKVNYGTATVDGPQNIMIDSTGLKVYGAGQWLEDKHGQKLSKAASGNKYGRQSARADPDGSACG